ncbi:MAG: hypothetical protein R3F65_16890 [bacterium]
MKISEDKLMDKRLIQRHLNNGLIDQATLQASLDALPDRADGAIPLKVRLTSVGLHDVKAKDTGEHE